MAHFEIGYSLSSGYAPEDSKPVRFVPVNESESYEAVIARRESDFIAMVEEWGDRTYFCAIIHTIRLVSQYVGRYEEQLSEPIILYFTKKIPRRAHFQIR